MSRAPLTLPKVSAAAIASCRKPLSPASNTAGVSAFRHPKRQTHGTQLNKLSGMSPIQAAMEHCRLKADLDAARADGDGWWIQEALGALTHLVEQRYASQSSACGPTAHDSLPHRVPDMLLILSRPIPVAQRRPLAG